MSSVIALGSVIKKKKKKATEYQLFNEYVFMCECVVCCDRARCFCPFVLNDYLITNTSCCCRCLTTFKPTVALAGLLMMEFYEQKNSIINVLCLSVCYLFTIPNWKKIEREEEKRQNRKQKHSHQLLWAQWIKRCVTMRMYECEMSMKVKLCTFFRRWL